MLYVSAELRERLQVSTARLLQPRGLPARGWTPGCTRTPGALTRLPSAPRRSPARWPPRSARSRAGWQAVHERARALAAESAELLAETDASRRRAVPDDTRRPSPAPTPRPSARSWRRWRDPAQHSRAPVAAGVGRGVERRGVTSIDCSAPSRPECQPRTGSRAEEARQLAGCRALSRAGIDAGCRGVATGLSDTLLNCRGPAQLPTGRLRGGLQAQPDERVSADLTASWPRPPRPARRRTRRARARARHSHRRTRGCATAGWPWCWSSPAS